MGVPASSSPAAILSQYHQPRPQTFKLLRELGRGSLGTNYKAVTRTTGKTVSLKVIKKERLRRSALEKRVVTNEQHVLSKLDHPLVVGFFCSFQTSNHLLIATEYLPDHTLQTIIAKVRRTVGHPWGYGLPKSQALFLLAELAAAIDYLHNAKMVLHGNIRPENVRVDQDGHARLAGFNYAQSCFPSGRRMVRPPPSGRSKHISTMMEFQSPELKAGLPHGHPADWYSYGAVAFFALTGLRPPPCAPLDSLLQAQQAELAERGLGDGAYDLVADLVCADPEGRLSFEGVRRHHFFAEVDDWAAVASKKAASGIGALKELDPTTPDSKRMAGEKFWNEEDDNADPEFAGWSKMDWKSAKFLF